MSFTINGTTGINLGTQPLTGSLPDANAPSGSVIQVVQGVLTTSASMTGTSQTSMGLSASITPTSASSKILITISGIWGISAGNLAIWRCYRGGSPIGGSSWQDSFATSQHQTGGATTGMATFLNWCYLDSPATTSSTTYTLYVASDNAGATIYFNRRPQDSGNTGVSTMTLMEIAA